MQLLPIEETADVVIFCPRVDQVDFGALNSAAVLVAFIWEHIDPVIQESSSLHQSIIKVSFLKV